MTPQEKVDFILDRFDFEKAHTVMRVLGWEWHNLDTPGLPEIYQMRQWARKLLFEAIKHPGDPIGSGEFETSYSEGILTLKFVVTSEEYDSNE